MDLFGRGELGLLGGGEGLRDDVGVSGISWTANRLPDDMYPASGLALAAAYHDIKTRLASLERENSSIKRKLKHYEVKFPMISEFGEERILCCSCEPIIKDTSVIQSETTNLQQRINSLTQELQKSKEREERLEEVIQAYEKIHLEKSNPVSGRKQDELLHTNINEKKIIFTVKLLMSTFSTFLGNL
uniref:TBK1 binding protein 1 n=1 Tax=Amphiprion percula TaxID=161767 RepID=A0A3P8RQ65_AMPPE